MKTYPEPDDDNREEIEEVNRKDAVFVAESLTAKQLGKALAVYDSIEAAKQDEESGAAYIRGLSEEQKVQNAIGTAYIAILDRNAEAAHRMSGLVEELLAAKTIDDFRAKARQFLDEPAEEDEVMNFIKLCLEA